MKLSLHNFGKQIMLFLFFVLAMSIILLTITIK